MFEVTDPLHGTMQVPDVEQQIQRILAPIQAEIDQLDAAERSLQSALRKVRADKARLHAVLRAAEPKEPKPARAKARPRLASSTAGVSSSKVDAILDYFKAHPDKEITGTELVHELKINTGAIYTALHRLEEGEQIRLAGIGGQTGRAKIYKLMPTGEN